MRRAARLQGFLIALALMGCAAAVVIGSGCRVYNEARLDRPSDDILRQAPIEVVAWMAALDVAMTQACTE